MFRQFNHVSRCIYNSQNIYGDFDILQRYIYTEYEVQIRNETKTPQGRIKLQELYVEFGPFQPGADIRGILKPWVSQFTEHSYREEISVAITATIGRILALVDNKILHAYIKFIQELYVEFGHT